MNSSDVVVSAWGKMPELSSALAYPMSNNKNRLTCSVLAFHRSSETNLELLERKHVDLLQISSAPFSWVENSSTASTPDGSSPGAMSWPGHFLSRGLVLIKVWANGNAPYSPTSSSVFLKPLSFFTPLTSREAKKYTFSLLPHFPTPVFVLLYSIDIPSLFNECHTCMVVSW